MKEKAKSLGLTHMDFDGCSEIWVKDWESYERFMNSPEYANVMNPDCKHFMEMPIHVMAGYENVIFGRAIPDSGGKDGVLESEL